MSASTATPASTAAASAVPAEACRSRFDGKNREFFRFDPVLTEQIIDRTIDYSRIPVARNQEFSRPEPGMDRRNREFTGKRGACHLWPGKVAIACANFAAELPMPLAFSPRRQAARLFHRAPAHRRIESIAVMRRKSDGGEGPGGERPPPARDHVTRCFAP